MVGLLPERFGAWECLFVSSRARGGGTAADMMMCARGNQDVRRRAWCGVGDGGQEVARAGLPVQGSGSS